MSPDFLKMPDTKNRKTDSEEAGDPIAGLSSAPGNAGVAVLRFSGVRTLTLLEALLVTRSGRPVSRLEPRRVHLAKIIDQGEILDHVILIPFSAGASYTGEESAEIHCHGNPVIISRILEMAFAVGFRASEPGEFTRRAVLNGKTDLSSASAIHDIVMARTIREVQSAQRMHGGEFRNLLLRMRTELLNINADFAAEIDFSDEDITFAAREAVLDYLSDQRELLDRTLQAAESLQIYQDGFRIAILGSPNAGKSSLLNKLCGKERSIVTAEAGTTRDYIEADMEIAGIPVRFTDTAGLRSATGEAEAIGIRRSLQKAEEADLILYLIAADADQPTELQQAQEVPQLQDPARLTLFVRSKADLKPEEAVPEGWIATDTRSTSGTDALLEKLTEIIAKRQAPSEAMLLSAWQKTELRLTGEYLSAARESIRNGEPPEIVSASLQNALDGIAALTGEITSEDLLGRVFSRFCIGK